MQAPSRARELLIALFVLGVALLTPPLLIVFNNPARILGIPVLYLYLFAVWVVLIGLVAVAVERGGDAADLSDTSAEARASEPSQAGSATDA
jgi:hypothetical protein